MIAQRLLRPACLQPLRLGRSFTTCRPMLQKQEEEERQSRGVKDPGTERHGYDPLKPRKPLSRIAVGDSRKYNPEKAEEQKMVGMLNWKAAVFFILTGAGLTWFFNKEKKRIEIQREAEQNRAVGKPQVGGPFVLTDHNGNKFSDKDLQGKFSLVYFGFTRCPDICPEELDNMTEILNDVNKDEKKLTPVFITCDPNRDPPELLKSYLSEFHPDIIGLTGTYDEIKDTCKKYRVYFSTPPDLKPGQDYLVDHSIFFYLMDPEGQFVDALGRQYTSETAAQRIKDHMAEWKPTAERENAKEGLWGRLFG